MFVAYFSRPFIVFSVLFCSTWKLYSPRPPLTLQILVPGHCALDLVGAVLPHLLDGMADPDKLSMTVLAGAVPLETVLVLAAVIRLDTGPVHRGRQARRCPGNKED